MVSVRTSVPAMNATPRTTATLGSRKPDLLARTDLSVSANISGSQRAHAVEDTVGSRVGEVVDDATVGEEHRTVGVRRRNRVVRHHHDRLTELTHGLTHEGEDLGARAGVEVAGGFVGE